MYTETLNDSATTKSANGEPQQDSEGSIHYPMDSFDEWRMRWKQIPLFVTEALEQIGKKYRYNLRWMEKKEKEILQEIEEQYPEVWNFLCPEGNFSLYLWHYTRSAFWIRHVYKSQGIAKEEWVEPALEKVSI